MKTEIDKDGYLKLDAQSKGYARRPMTLDTSKLRALALSATPGPYAADLDMFDNEIEACISNAATSILFTAGTDCVVPSAHEWTEELQAKADAAWALAKESQALRDALYIAALSPSTVLGLLNRIVELEQACDAHAEVANETGDRLSTTRQQLAEVKAARDELATMARHLLKNPAASIVPPDERVARIATLRKAGKLP